jgi:hypothetical protein
MTLGWAVIGLLVGHVAAYDLVFPDGHVHDAALAASGHAWLGMLEPSLLLAMGFVAIGAALAASDGQPRDVRFRRLAVIQVGAFMVMELGERILAGYSAPDLSHALVDHGLWLILVVGIVTQVITAWFGSAMSRGIASATTRSRPRLPRRSRHGSAPILRDVPFASLPHGHRRDRAPPTWAAIP